MKRLILSSAVISAVVLSAVAFSRAFFSDTETSQGNVLGAGKIDLKIDNESYYNGQKSDETTWSSSDLPGHLFFNFNDIKPSDWGEDTISVKSEDNDAWSCMNIKLTKNDDNTCTEPETADDNGCVADNQDTNDGELAGLLNFAFWADDGDNVYEDNETIWKQGKASDLFNGEIWPLADSSVNIWTTPTITPLTGGTTFYIGKYWCFGTLQATPIPADQGQNPTVASGFSCSGIGINNASQTDIVTADVEFSAVQARHNQNFLCSGEPQPSVSPSPSISLTPSPTPLTCGQADVMLVLDRSGSISSTELASLKTAADAFVDALGLTASGVHAGMSSFATTGTLNQHLIDNGSTLKTSINALSSGGFTNLSEGINLAKTELDNPGDGHDRADGTSPDKMIIITDGHPNRPLPEDTADDLAKTAADNARTAGSEIFVVGVGSDVNASYLQMVADSASHYYSASDYSGLQTALQNLDLCQ